jgi:mono/diheme cytochrome c family protein
LLILSALAVGVVVNMGCDRDGEPVLTEHAGYPAYKKYCRRCHGNRGGGRKASRMAERPVDLVAPAYRDTADLKDILTIVTDGRGLMKGYREKLTPGELEDVSRYVSEMPDRSEQP